MRELLPWTCFAKSPLRLIDDMNGSQEHPEKDKRTSGTDASPEAPEEARSTALADALASSFAIVRVIMLALVVLFLFSGCFTVGSQEKAVVLRFGKPVGEGEKGLLGPGLHWAFPAPIDEVVRIPVGQLHTVSSTIGWYATTSAAEATGKSAPDRPSLNPNLDGYLLTGDENIIHVQGTVLYRINEPGLRYAFDFSNSSNLVQNAFNNALVYAAAGFNVDDALTRGEVAFRDRVRERLNQLIALYHLDISIEQISLRKSAPGKLVKAFDSVTDADIRRSQGLNQARDYANQTLSQAGAQAQERRNAGEREADALVKAVQAEADTFKGLLSQYKANPDLFVQQRQNQVVQRVLTNAQYRLVLPRRSDGKPREVRIQINPGRAPVIKPVEPPPTSEEKAHGG
jgi:membrane protease subunit HflK